jgi:hypothetical protein
LTVTFKPTSLLCCRIKHDLTRVEVTDSNKCTSLLRCTANYSPKKGLQYGQLYPSLSPTLFLTFSLPLSFALPPSFFPTLSLSPPPYLYLSLSLPLSFPISLSLSLFLFLIDLGLNSLARSQPLEKGLSFRPSFTVLAFCPTFFRKALQHFRSKLIVTKAVPNRAVRCCCGNVCNAHSMRK